MFIGRGIYLQILENHSHAGKRHMQGHKSICTLQARATRSIRDLQLFHISGSCCKFLDALYEQPCTLLPITDGAKVYLKANGLPRALQDEGPRCRSQTMSAPKTRNPR